ncbi:hypothetical protein [Nocardia huaxiensis]|uniref:Secreted protein n=1 Tax=Nocardia huaxiensis TaxID=2755382 RepID=A0A7D6VEL4_9NOCA|nr:hypothetical protein [Nocardia huaxiensis]QLY30735.1 hypothetical protein H0264_37550 [Nocardia huaxiensis]UFS94230.1 hypothetical protein LPY97_26145 [Nocardia huaxiensis]
MARTEELRLEELSPRVAAATLRDRFDTAELRLFARSSPAKLIAIGLLLLGLCVAAGAVTATAVTDRQHALDVLLDQAEPDAYSAQRLYTSLSVADASAGTAFISGGLEPKAVRDRYTQALGEAAAELVTQSDRSGGEDTHLRTGIATGLPVYSGLVETARTNNRLGEPVGAAYLSEASNLMQSTMLPMAHELQEHRAAAITETQRNHVRPPWPAIVLPLLAVAALTVAQVFLFRHWNRVLNAGLLLATATMVVLLSWTVVAGFISAVDTTRARDDGSVPTSYLTESRILVQQARTAETLKLVRRDMGTAYDQTYDQATERLREILAEYPSDAPGAKDVATATAALDRWRGAHQRMNDALSRGDFIGAGAVATGSGANEATAQVDALDRALADGIGDTRYELRANTSHAARTLDLLAPGALVLSTAAAVLIAAGLWPRLREYR